MSLLNTNLLNTKARRDIARQKWQFIAVLVTVVLGVSLFAGSYNAYLNLGSSLEGSYERLHMADATVIGAGDDFADQVRGLDGVDDAIARRQADIPFGIGDDTLIGRVAGVPADGQPAVNMLDVDEGTWLDPDIDNGVLLESHAAKDFDLGLGDTFEVAGATVEVVGIVTSTEYLWPARDSQNAFTAPKSFAVVFADEALLDAVGAASVTEQVLVHYADGADTEQTDQSVISAAADAGTAGVQLLADQPSNAIIEEEIGALQSMAVAMPALFLAAAGLAVYVVVTRLVFSQRGVIGTLRASGFSRRQMRNHYLMYGVSCGIVGALIGAVLGGLLGRGMTALYTQVFGIPDLVATFHLPTVVIALLFGAIAGVLAGAAPARTVSRLAPAEAMRGDVPTGASKPSIFERLVPPLRRVPVRWRMTLRGIGRNTKRSTSMVLGVVLGMTLIMASWGMLDTMILAMDRQFDEISLEDATIVTTEEVSDATVDGIAAVEGVAVAEPVIGLSAVVDFGGATFTTLVEGYEVDTEVHGFDPPLPADGALLGAAMEDLLDVAEGDTVTIELPLLELSVETVVAGFVDEPLGTSAYLSAESLTSLITDADPQITADALTAPTITSVKAVFDDGVDRDAVLAALGDLDDTAVVVDGNQVRDLVEDFQAFFYLFIGLMVIFGGAMAFALVFNIISVNVAERSSEFASMRANGLTHRRVARMIAGETGILTAIGIIPGWIVGYLAAVAFMNSFSSPEFPITAQLRPLSYVVTALVMFAVAALSLIPALRAVKRIDIGAIVRERST